MDQAAKQKVCTSRAEAAVMAALTQENIVKHEAAQGNHVLYSHSSEADQPEENAVFMIGGVTTLSASKPKTCGIALAMVALFCYFPGISLTVSVVSTGITNKSGIGIVFLSVAVSLTVVSIVLCCKSRLDKKSKKADVEMGDETNIVATAEPHEEDQGTAPLLSNRHDDVIHEKEARKLEPVYSLGTKSIDLMLSRKIARSFVMKRYFEQMYSMSGPFALDREQMDKLTEVALRDTVVPPSDCPVPNKNIENSSSNDSAIEIESEPPTASLV